MNKWIFHSTQSFQSILSIHGVYGAKCQIFCLKNMSRFTQHRVQHSKVKQIGTVGLCWIILLVTIYHFFIGHKWSTSVSTWLSFHTKHLNRDSSPISLATLCLFKPTCVSYIKSHMSKRLFYTRKCIFSERFDYRTQFGQC